MALVKTKDFLEKNKFFVPSTTTLIQERRKKEEMR